MFPSVGLHTGCRRAMDDNQNSTVPVLSFPEISSGDSEVPTAWGAWMDTKSISNSQQAPCPAEPLSWAPPGRCQGVVIFHHLLPQLNLHRCLRGQRRWGTKTETPQGQQLSISSSPTSEASLVQSPSVLQPEIQAGQLDPRSFCCNELEAAALNCSPSFYTFPVDQFTTPSATQVFPIVIMLQRPPPAPTTTTNSGDGLAFCLDK